MVLINLFLVFLKVGLFSMGGAYSFLPVMERELVQRYQWLSKEEFLDVLGMTQIFPGALSIKYATYTGYKIAGILGAIFANLGNLIPAAFLIIFISYFYSRYKDNYLVKDSLEAIRLCILALVIAVILRSFSFSKLIQLKSLVLVLFSLWVFIYTKVHPAIIIILVGLIAAFWR